MTLIQISEPTSNQDQLELGEKNQEIVVGIDLGTTNSLIAAKIDNQIIFFSDQEHNQIHPSIVAFDENLEDFICAINALESKNKVKISSIKRLMGKSLNDIKKDPNNFKNLSFEIDQSVGQKGSIRIIIGNKKFSPEEISAKILTYLKNLAEKTLNQKITKAVITVPAYFDEAARSATKLAAKLAGLEVLRLLNEPTAAALAYNLDHQKEGIYLVYDLGGGTFDVSILKMQKGVFKVLGVSGNTELGGDDFDLLIVKQIQEKITKNYNLSEFDFSENYDLKAIAKKIKEELSDQENSNHEITFRDKKFNFEIMRLDFIKLITDKVNNSIKITNNLVADLEMEIAEIKGVVMVGGTTRIPYIKEKLAAIFGAKKILSDLDPDRIVAYGAAMQASNLVSKNNNLLLDVVPLSLGLEMMGGITEKIIARNSTIPTSVTKEYTTYVDGQGGIKLHIVQGERELAKDNRSLGELEIKNIPPLKAGIPKIAVTFKIDADGLLTVSAKEEITGQIQEIIVKPSYGLEAEEIKQMLLESLKNASSDMTARLLAESLVEAKKDIAVLENDLKEYQNLISQEEEKTITKQLLKLKDLITNSSDRDLIISECKTLEKLSENFILKKINQNLNATLAGKKIDEVL
jgi:molecular chaperone HscA